MANEYINKDEKELELEKNIIVKISNIPTGVEQYEGCEEKIYNNDNVKSDIFEARHK
jgi:hypothetical protein